MIVTIGVQYYRNESYKAVFHNYLQDFSENTLLPKGRSNLSKTSTENIFKDNNINPSTVKYADIPLCLLNKTLFMN